MDQRQKRSNLRRQAAQNELDEARAAFNLSLIVPMFVVYVLNIYTVVSGKLSRASNWLQAQISDNFKVWLRSLKTSE